MSIDNRPFDPKRELDQVVGRFEEGGGFLERLGRMAGKMLIGASLAVGAAALVIYTLHTHVKQAQTAPAPKKPVPVNIIPAK